MVIRIALSSHDSVGLGHVRRNLAIAHALTRGLPALRGEEVTGILLTGDASATAFPAPPGWDWVVLPSVTVGEGGYRSRHLVAGIDRITAMRGGAAAAVLRAFGPDLFIVDRHPFGVHGELTDAIRQLREHRPSCVTVLGLRDVLDRAAVAREEFRQLGGASAVRDHYDAVWVYGDPTVHDMRDTGELPPGLHDLVSHTGYLAHGRSAPATLDTARPFVLTTLGGGSDGVRTALAAAAAEVPAGHDHLVVTGPQMPAADRSRVRAAATAATRIVDSVANMPELVGRAAAVTGMGGYNTVCEVMSTATPLLVVPRASRRDEQRIRAAALARVGAVETTAPEHLTAATVADFFARSVGRRVTRTEVDLGGLDAIAPLAALTLDRTPQEAIAHAV
ncbi:glycosyl transferase [Agromyces atrinae]|uniref:glycosyltransferase family protein n=1 Tax=Agromyces atrinae TaxID=592376 RepID=UPI001F55B442|nr:glycosyltransferase [Agromyces atrinae]MCI2956223.1 glycosyl transferase [Agromyces atrinae]